MNHRDIKKVQKSGEGEGAERRSLSEWLSLKLDIPSDIASGMRIELRGRHTLLLHGCCGILTYTPQEMKFRLSDGELRVTGARLVCHSYLAGAVGVEGRIDSLSLSEPSSEHTEDSASNKEALC